ncbi:MAG TPA: transglycosylase domain-containing protein, partial [Nitriliruptorales bacterium]|nr:transglycosylase domain-containing protein [Nitriliruptorales bacterium]
MALVAFFAWLALQVRWDVPDPAALTGPSVVLARDGTPLARFSSEVDRRVVGLESISDVTLEAVVAHEDARFYEHRGVDPMALLRAVWSNLRTGGVHQGGSTLTQQYVKNAFTQRERTVARKVREAVISIQLERDVGKRGILERYLNTVYFGEGAYGIEAAALTYFGIHASELSAAQAAALVQVLPAPSRRNPRVDQQGALERRNALLDRMVALGSLTSAEAGAARSEPLEVRPREPLTALLPHFVTYVRSTLEATYGPEQVLTGGLQVTTTIDLGAQAKLEEAVRGNVPTPQTGVEAGAVALDPRTGDILAMHGGWDFYGDTRSYSSTNYAQFNLATQAQRQPGSAFKPFVLTVAMEQGIAPSRRYPAPRTLDVGGPKPVHNADGRGYGSLTLERALVRSVNTVYARLGLEVGPDRVVEILSRLGVRSPIEPVGLIGIGGTTRGPTVLDLASAYATLANDGVACPARAVLEVRGADGRELEPPAERIPSAEVLEGRPDGLGERDDGRCYDAVDRDIARTVNQILQRVVAEGTGTGARIDRPQAGKTGTTNEFVDAWFAGYTPNLSLAVWVGDPDERRPLVGIAGIPRVFGGTLPAQVWRDAAQRLLEAVPPEEFPEPGDLSDGRRRPGPPMSRGVAPAPGPMSSATPTSEASPTASPSPSAT